MARRKVRLAYISNEAQRKASYKKRKKGLLKKLEELTILCNVEACAIMYSAFDTKPVVWPSVEGMQHTVARFKSLPNVEQTRRMLNQERFVQERIHKLSTTLIKLRKENREKQMIVLMYRILVGEHIIEPLNAMDLNDLGWVINMHLVEINNKIEAIKKEDGASPSIQGWDSGRDTVAINMSNILIGSSCRGVVPPSMFNFQGGASSSNAVAPDMFNLMVGPSTGHAMPPSMYNFQDGASSSNGTTPDMLNYQVGASGNRVVAPSKVNFQAGISRNNTEARGGFNNQQEKEEEAHINVVGLNHLFPMSNN